MLEELFAVARKAGAVGFKSSSLILSTSGLRKSNWNSKVNDVDELLSQSDVISLHIPANSETSKMVDKSFLKK